jgi:hypothetical protein
VYTGQRDELAIMSRFGQWNEIGHPERRVALVDVGGLSRLSQSSVICAEVDHGADGKSRRPASSPRRPGRLQAGQFFTTTRISGAGPSGAVTKTLPKPRSNGSAGAAELLGNVRNARLMLRLSRRLGPLRGCQWFNALQIRGKGRALHVLIPRAFGIDRRRVR